MRKPVDRVLVAMENNEDEFYEISAVARLTGVSPHTLRVWERRYGVVEPRRSESGRRQYSQSDIQRLALLKALVDHGHAIGSVAKLTLAQLEDRLSSVLDRRASEDSPRSAPAGEVSRIGVTGPIDRRVLQGAIDSTAMRFVGSFRDTNEMLESLRPGKIDLLIHSQDTLFPEDIAMLSNAMNSAEISRSVLVYQFAEEGVIDSLKRGEIIALRAPVDAGDLRLVLNSLCLSNAPVAEERQVNPDFETVSGEIPPRIFSHDQLLQLSNLSSAVKCECPQHLADLIGSLLAFEKYSRQCENRNEEDAALHAYLHASTARARSEMEGALSKVLEQEGISLA